MTSATLPLQTSAASAPARRSSVLTRVIATPKDPVALLIRVLLGVVMLPHGAQKLLGWFGGYGFTGTMQFFTETMHIPYAFGVLAIGAEFFGAIALITGFFSRIAAFGVAVVMIVATLTSHLANGFFMNWSGQQAGEGFEFHLLALALAVAVMIRGAGAVSIDRLLSARSR